MPWRLSTFSLAFALTILEIDIWGFAAIAAFVLVISASVVSIQYGRLVADHCAVVAAYTTASAEGEHAIESVVEETDPSFLTRLKNESR